MAGSVAAVGIVGALALLTAGLAAAGSAAVVGQRVASAADAAALAAADSASGATTGAPCVRADEVARAHGARLEGCELDDLIATVTVSAPFGPLGARASARAGPPSSSEP